MALPQTAFSESPRYVDPVYETVWFPVDPGWRWCFACDGWGYNDMPCLVCKGSGHLEGPMAWEEEEVLSWRQERGEAMPWQRYATR